MQGLARELVGKARDGRGQSMWRHPRSSFQDEKEGYLKMQGEVALAGVPRRKTWRWAWERARESA